MRKTLVAGFVLVGLFSGCMSEMDPALKRQYDLDAYRWQCENNAGIKDNTPEMEVCIQQKDEGSYVSQRSSEKNVYVEFDTPRSSTTTRGANNQMSGEAWIRMGSMYTCQSRGGFFNHNTGQCTLPQQPRGGSLYNSSGEYIGTYREN